MTFDEGLAHRVREVVVDEREVTEKRMFGGLAFLVNGHMSVTISRRGGIMARLGPQQAMMGCILWCSGPRRTATLTPSWSVPT